LISDIVIAFLAPFPPAGSVSRYVKPLVSEISKNAKVIVISPPDTSKFKSNERIMCKRIHPNLKIYYVERGLRGYVKAVYILRELRPAILHIQDDSWFLFPWLPIFLYIIRKALKNTTIIITLHELLLVRTKTFIRRKYSSLPKFLCLLDFIILFLHYMYVKLIAAQAECIIVLNQYAKYVLNKFYKVGDNKIRVIPHGTTLDYVMYKYTPIPIFLYVGNLSPYKGLDILLKASKILDSKKERMIILICGAEPKYPWSRRIIRKLLHEASSLQFTELRYLGFVDDSSLVNLIQYVKAFVVLYKDVTTSGTVYLAYSFGRPVIASKLPEFVFQVYHEISGFLAPLNPNNVAEALIKMKERSLESFRGHIMKISSKYHWSNIASIHMRLYEELLYQK